MKTNKLIKVIYQYTELPAEELQQRLDDAFELLFRETMKNFDNDENEINRQSTSFYDNYAVNKN